MTTKQKKLLEFIKNYRQAHGVSPILDEMAKHMGGVANSTIHEHLQNLIKQGYLEKEGYRQSYKEVADDRDEMLELIFQLSDEAECRLDRNGHCQTHYWFDNEEECANKRALRMLKKYKFNED